MWRHGVGVVVTVVAMGGDAVTWQYYDTNKSKCISKEKCL